MDGRPFRTDRTSRHGVGLPLSAPLRNITSSVGQFGRARWSDLPAVTEVLPQTDGIGVLEYRAAEGAAGEHEVHVPPLQNHVLSLVAERTATRNEVQIEGRWRSFVRNRGDATVIPRGVETRWRARGRRDRMLQVHLDPAWLEGFAGESGLPGSAASLPILVAERHDDLVVLLDAVRDRLEELTGSRLLVEQWVENVAARLLRLDRTDPKPRRMALAPARLAKVKAYVEANLDRDLGLVELASVAGVSRYHFARTFRADTGETPHAYVMRQRCERAKALILTGAVPLAEVAQSCGFTHQAHFTTAFRRVVGTTPGRWRSEHLR